jgi:GntR family histidine utilization transcriptional repressor
VTLHARIKHRLLELILGGKWQPGRQIPIETELADRFGVSRMTMNKVMTQLSQEGYLVRRKKSGTFVARPRSQSAVMQIASIRAEVAALGKPYRWQLDERRLRPLSDAETALLGPIAPDEDGPLLVVRGVHFAGERPFCREERVINPAITPEALAQDFDLLEPGQWLLDTMPWISATHILRAVNASDDEARALDLRPDQACLEILRQTWVQSGWVTRVRLLYSGATHQLVAQFQPQGEVPPAPPAG